MDKKTQTEFGKTSFKNTQTKKDKNRSPTKQEISRRTILNQIEFCNHELKIHRENQNNVMIAYKLEEIATLEKQIKN